MGNPLNKPYMEVEGKLTTENTSTDGWTVLKKTAIFEERVGRGMGGPKLKSDKKHPWGII